MPTRRQDAPATLTHVPVQVLAGQLRTHQIMVRNKQTRPAEQRSAVTGLSIRWSAVMAHGAHGIHGVPHRKRPGTQSLGDIGAQGARPWQRDGVVGLLDRRGPSLADDGVLILAGMVAGEEPFRQRRQRIIVRHCYRPVHGIRTRVQGVEQLLPEDRGALRPACCGPAARVAAALAVRAI